MGLEEVRSARRSRDQISRFGDAEPDSNLVNLIQTVLIRDSILNTIILHVKRQNIFHVKCYENLASVCCRTVDSRRSEVSNIINNLRFLFTT